MYKLLLSVTFFIFSYSLSYGCIMMEYELSYVTDKKYSENELKELKLNLQKKVVIISYLGSEEGNCQSKDYIERTSCRSPYYLAREVNSLKHIVLTYHEWGTSCGPYGVRLGESGYVIGRKKEKPFIHRGLFWNMQYELYRIFSKQKSSFSFLSKKSEDHGNEPAGSLKRECHMCE